MNALNKAKKTILVQAYALTSPPIAAALVEANKRGVDVQVILDKSQKTERFLRNVAPEYLEVPVFIDASHKIAHNKVILQGLHVDQNL